MNPKTLHWPWGMSCWEAVRKLLWGPPPLPLSPWVKPQVAITRKQQLSPTPYHAYEIQDVSLLIPHLLHRIQRWKDSPFLYRNKSDWTLKLPVGSNEVDNFIYQSEKIAAALPREFCVLLSPGKDNHWGGTRLLGSGSLDRLQVIGRGMARCRCRDPGVSLHQGKETQVGWVRGTEIWLNRKLPKAKGNLESCAFLNHTLFVSS